MNGMRFSKYTGTFESYSVPKNYTSQSKRPRLTEWTSSEQKLALYLVQSH